MGFHIYTGNRLETLAEKLAEIIRIPLSSPLVPETIVVQSRGMERWVSMQLATHNRVCANIHFPFPNAFLHETFQTLLPDVPDITPFDPDILTFRIMKRLTADAEQPEFESLRSYLKDDLKGMKHFQLSEKIADIFDQYLIFRPEMISAWENGKGSLWQARLWRQLTDKEDHLHRARLRMQFFKEIRKPVHAIAKFPERISIFGISHLPNFHMQVFAALSRHIPVYMFLMSPCREFWGDIVSGRDRKRIRRRYQGPGVSDGDLHLESGNSLLASMGALGRDFLNIITEFECEFHEHYDEIENRSLLTAVQSDILNLKDRIRFDLADKSGSQVGPASHTGIQIHSCHSPMREIEVLHDSLLRMFDELPGLLPKDIIVMTPDIEAYSPFVQAVFGAETPDGLRIPYTIADRNIRHESPVVDAFTAFLDFKTSRFGSSEILSILEIASIRNKFGISDSDLETIAHWIQDTGIRWGIDGKNRGKLDLPDSNENTWKAGIERLLLGYAMRSNNNQMFAGVLPYDPMEGSDVKILGRFVEFMERFFRWTERLETDETLSGWSRVFHSLLDHFFHTDEETERELQPIRTLIDELTDNQELSGYSEPITFEVVRSFLLHRLEQEGFGSGFISGGVTFCAMLPMRSIPFEVVCLVGMNSDAFPRESRSVGFDLVAKYPKPGDRSRRNDDRYLFLETILSARKKLYISYIGQGIQDDSVIPPSVLVSELMDYLTEGFGIEGKDILTHHRLQAFSPEYFRKDKEKLFSYDEENMLASTSLLGPKQITPFISKGLTEPGDEWKRISILELRRFLMHPARYLLQNRLGIFFKKESAVSNDRENFELDFLDRYLIGQELVECGLAGRDLESMLPVFRASGRLPHGSVGAVRFREMSQAANEFANKVRDLRGESTGKSMEIDLNLACYQIHGELKHFHKDIGLVRYRFADMKPKDLLTSWIDHLLLGEMEAVEYPNRSILICRDTVLKFNPVNGGKRILKSILSRYWEGLLKPLPFFPGSSYRYAIDVIERQKSASDALRAAQNHWQVSDFRRGESEDPYFRRCFGSTDPLDTHFQNLALEIFEPLLGHISRITAV